MNFISCALKRGYNRGYKSEAGWKLSRQNKSLDRFGECSLLRQAAISRGLGLSHPIHEI
jgi:hypothetical protein